MRSFVSQLTPETIAALRRFILPKEMLPAWSNLFEDFPGRISQQEVFEGGREEIGSLAKLIFRCTDGSEQCLTPSFARNRD